MVPDSLLYLPLTIHAEADIYSYAPLLPTTPSTSSGLGAFVLTADLGSFHQGLYVLENETWRFALPQPVVSDVLIRGYEVDVYVGLDSPLTVPAASISYKNGVLSHSPSLQGHSVFCVLSPRPSEFYLKASRTLDKHRVLKTADDGADYASSNVPADAFKVAGISAEAASQGQLVRIQTTGELTDSGWNWEVGQPVFNGIDGNLTQENPSVGYSLIVGIAIKPSSILISMKQPIILD